MAVVGLKNLCTPAYVYLVISVIAIIIMALQNMSNPQLYCIGMYSCQTSSIVTIFLLKIVYVIFWTWILNIICSAGATNLAWFLVLLPYILLFIFIGILML
jgi:hypothetical protein